MSQSDSASSSAVVAPNVRTSDLRRPLAAGVRRQATTIFLCTSSPQHRSNTVSIFTSFMLELGGVYVSEILLSVLPAPARVQQDMAPGDAQVTLTTSCWHQSESSTFAQLSLASLHLAFITRGDFQKHDR